MVLGHMASLVVALGLWAACSLPALDADDYLAKTEAAVEDAISQANSAILATGLRSSDRLPATTTTVLLEDVERAAADSTDAFASILPPDQRSDDLRARVLPVLDEVADLLSRMRFAARRGDAVALEGLRSSLSSQVATLERWLENA